MIVEDHLPTLPGEAEGDGPSDARGGSGYQNSS